MPMIKTEINGKIATLTLNNDKKLNALSHELINESMAFIKECRNNNVFIILLKAEPNKHNVWSAGHDVTELPKGKRDPLGYFDALEVLLRGIQKFPGPVIGVVRGSVWGGACDLIMTCDMVYADPTATFAITPAKIGIPYNVTGIMHFINRIGISQAKEMFFRAKPVDAETALNWGIINRLFKSEELDAKAMEIAEDICSNSNLAVSVIKEQFRLLANASSNLPPITFERIQGLRRRVYDSLDYAEGINSFLEKRKPVYTGK